MPTYDDIFSWPKAELHCHLDGSVRPATVLELVEKQKKTHLMPGSDPGDLEVFFGEIDNSGTLEAYLSWFSLTTGILQDADSLERAAYELVEDAAAENVRYIEIRYSPILHTGEGLDLDAVNDAVLRGLHRGENETGTKTSLIICGLRERPESVSLRLAELAVQYKDRGVVAFDLAGPEAGNPPKHHLSAFYFARNNLMNLTIHAGESWGPESIRQALFHCGAHRIGHGTSLGQNPDLLRYVADHQIALEICPTSNVQTGVVDSFETHPLATYVRENVPVTISTDNRLFSRTNLTEELLRVHEQCGLTEAELRQVVVNGFRHAFLHLKEREELLSEVEAELLS